MKKANLFPRSGIIRNTLLFYFLFVSYVNGQEGNAIAVKSRDLIIMFSKDTLNVTVVRNAPDVVEYKYENESAINVISKKQVHKIIYSSGRVEICNEKKNLPTISDKRDWEKVIITFDEKDVIGLNECGTIVGKSGWGGVVSVPAGEHIMKDMKKDAAELGAPIVLVTEGWHKEKNKPISGYARGVKLTGKAYK